MIMRILKKIITYLFIDNQYLYLITHCHQLADRSFFLDGRQFHVCARCTGIIIGILFSPFLILLGFKISLIIAGVGTFLIIVDGGTQLIHIRESTNSIRFITGILFGLPFLSIAYFILIYLVQALH